MQTTEYGDVLMIPNSVKSSDFATFFEPLGTKSELSEKYDEASLSAKAVGCDKKTQKFLGITLWPQAGVALGMALQATQLGADGDIVRNITLFAVLIYEIVGPFLTKVSLTCTGDINPEGKKSSRGKLISE